MLTRPFPVISIVTNCCIGLVQHSFVDVCRCYYEIRRLIAQIIVPSEDAASDTLPNAGRQQFASFGWSDLWAVAPWMDERITKRIDGPGLGNWPVHELIWYMHVSPPVIFTSSTSRPDFIRVACAIQGLHVSNEVVAARIQGGPPIFPVLDMY